MSESTAPNSNSPEQLPRETEVPDVAEAGTETEPGATGATDDAKKRGPEPTVPERIRKLVDALAAALVWDGEHAYAIMQAEGNVRCLPVGSNAFRRWVTVTAREVDGMNPPSREAFGTAERAIEALAESRGGVEPTPSIRVAGARGSGEIYLDLGGNDWKCVHVTAEGWEVVPHPADGPYMYRPPRMAALPEPERGGDVNRLWYHLNVASENERLLLLAVIIQMLWPRGPYPVLVIFGEQGSTKTTVEEVIKSLTDPSRPSPDKHALTSLRKPPRDERDVVAAAKGARVIGFDNVSYLDEWLSDAICRLSTGADMGGRELYSDFDEAIVSAIRPVMINGIPEVVGRADLADRAVKIEARPPARRREEAELWQEFATDRPQLLGALLDLLVLTLRRWPDAGVTPGVDVRMADFARVGEAMCMALGMEPGTFTRAYHENRTNAAREVADLDSLTPRLENLLDRQDDATWTGSVGELLAGLKEGETGLLLSGKGWWSSAKALQTHLARQVAPLRAVGIEIEKHGHGRSPISGKSRTLYMVRRAPQVPAQTR